MISVAAPDKVLPSRSTGSSFVNPIESWRRVEMVVSLTLAVPLGELRASTRRDAATAFARQVAMYLAHVVLGMRYSAIGRLCGRDRKTVVHACRTVEYRREDPHVDRLLRVLEAFCCDMADFAEQTPQVRA